jgi:hypothetical protein
MSNGANSVTNQIHGLAKGKSPVVVMTVAGLLGGIAGFILSETIQGGDTNRFFPESLYLSTGVWFLLIIVGIGLLLSASQGIIEKNVEKSTSNILTALPALAIGGFISGAVAQKVYEVLLENDGSQVTARTIAWGIAGGLGGLAVGAGFRSVIRVRNCGIGGLGGGLLGGLLFDQISTGGGSSARFVGIVLIGTLMGLFIALLDAATTDYYLELASSELRGQQFVLFDQSSVIGCARTVAVTLMKDPLVAEQHVKATKTSNGLAIECLRGAPAVMINGQSTQNGILPVGGTIQIGNTLLVLQSKKGKSVRPVGSVAAVPNSGSQTPQAFSNQSSRPSEPVKSRPTIQMNNKPKQ